MRRRWRAEPVSWASSVTQSIRLLYPGCDSDAGWMFVHNYYGWGPFGEKYLSGS